MTGLQSYLAAITEVFDALLTMFGSVLEFILANPVLAIPAGVGILFTVIAIVKGFVYGQN